MVTQALFRCLGDPIRRSILEMLAGSRLTVTEIAGHFEVSRPAVSRHLRVLRDAGVVSEMRSGRERLYRLESEELEGAIEWLHSVVAGPVRLFRDESGEADVSSPEEPPEAVESGAGSDWRQW